MGAKVKDVEFWVVSDPIEINRVWGSSASSSRWPRFQTLSKSIGYGGRRDELQHHQEFQTLSKSIGYGGYKNIIKHPNYKRKW